MARRSGGGDLRNEILEVATTLLQRLPLHKLTMEDVARQTGIARQTIYKHFSGRDELLIALYIRQIDQNHRPVLERHFADTEPSTRALLDLIMTEIKIASEFALFDEVLDPNIAPRMAELVFGSVGMAEAREDYWLPILRRYEESGVLRPGLDHRAMSRWITYQQFWLLTHPTALTKEEDELTAYVRDFMVAAVVTAPLPPGEIIPTPREKATGDSIGNL
ncbi:TetR/AcrR family transcriptional regulator [Pseudonocardia xishanensis]|uniref:HTH tetR-type domain-containing protein n=1 Tax=Pseudonocardia xishanensis TaxID=630995 RepID=A0ABP8RV16_9PSEU